MDDKQHWQDWVNVLLGLWVFGSPWLIEHTMITEVPGGGLLGMWNAWVVGLVVVVIAGIAVYAYKAWEEWTNIALGLWLLVSPWVLGFSKSAALMWNAVIFGVLILVFAGWILAEEAGGFGQSQPGRKA